MSTNEHHERRSEPRQYLCAERVNWRGGMWGNENTGWLNDVSGRGVSFLTPQGITPQGITPQGWR